MKYKQVPVIDGKISAVGFGCWAAGGSDIWNQTTDQDSILAIQRAVGLGVNLFDVAPVYGLGHAEKILGEALGHRRKDVLIASKCGLVWDDAKNVTVSLKANSLFQEIDESLKRLNTDYIDIYQMHWPDPQTPIEESMNALMKIKESGKIRYIGVSNFSLELTKAAAAAGEIVSHQGLYNLLERNPTSYHNIPLTYQVENEILPYCQDKGMAFWPYSPLFQGLLTGQFNASRNFDDQDVRSENPKLKGNTYRTYFEIAEKVNSFAAEIDKPLTQVAINWLIEQPAVTSVICGAQNIAHIEENAGSVDWDLTQEMMIQIENILLPYKEYLHS